MLISKSHVRAVKRKGRRKLFWAEGTGHKGTMTGEFLMPGKIT